MVIQESCAHKVLARLGKLGAVQFTDLNSQYTLFQRRYVNEVTRCEALERKLKYLEEELERFKVSSRGRPDTEDFFTMVDKHGEDNLFNKVESMVDSNQEELLELVRYNTNLTSEYAAQEELKHVLEKARNYAAEGGEGGAPPVSLAPVRRDVEAGVGGRVGGRGSSVGSSSRFVAIEDGSLRFRFVAGVCIREDKRRLERMLFRSTRGNFLMRFYDVDTVSAVDSASDAAGGSEEGAANLKTVFIIFFQSQLVEDKIRKICEAFSARLHAIPNLDDVAAIDARAAEVHADLQDRERVLSKNRHDIVQLLTEVGKRLETWRFISLREKSIHHTMNMFGSDVQGVLRAEGWVLAAKQGLVVELVQQAHAEAVGGGASRALPSSVSVVPRESWPSTPPTSFKLNKVTQVFQVVVNTYGVPRYQEANPAVMAAITFPFSFGVMFGDIGHGTLLFLFALFVVWNEKALARAPRSEMMEYIFGGRYMLVLMGFFAIFCGFIYNDFFAMGLLLWPTHWTQSPSDPTLGYWGFTVNTNNTVYPLGVDPTWHRASNDLMYFNSLKMKMSVIFGVVQMTLGLVHRAQNAVFFERRLAHNLDLWFEALPMIVFMSSLFGYMCFLIIYKWSLQWVWEPVPLSNGTVVGCSPILPGLGSSAPGCDRTNCCNPPMLITMLINIALKPGSVDVSTQLYDGQGSAQAILLLLAVLMVPLMLCPKPYFEIQRIKAKHAQAEPEPFIGSTARRGSHNSHTELMLHDDEHQEHGEHDGDEAHEEGHNSGDIIIHQIIEVIEFTLGCISNTASYLRLWALSLAHSQLASVFLEKAMLGPMEMNGAAGVIGSVLGYGAFACITFAVLMCMDNLECFLHALRLQWVEFQSKFLKGDGIAFTPLDFRVVLTEGTS